MNPLEIKKVIGQIKSLASTVDKDYFLDQTKIEWSLLLPRDFDVEKEAEKSWKRITKSKVLKGLGLTKEDIERILEEIKEERMTKNDDTN